MTRTEKTLAVILRVLGIIVLFALFPIVMPMRWMGSVSISTPVKS